MAGDTSSKRRSIRKKSSSNTGKSAEAAPTSPVLIPDQIKSPTLPGHQHHPEDGLIQRNRLTHNNHLYLGQLICRHLRQSQPLLQDSAMIVLIIAAAGVVFAIPSSLHNKQRDTVFFASSSV